MSGKDSEFPFEKWMRRTADRGNFGPASLRMMMDMDRADRGRGADRDSDRNPMGDMDIFDMDERRLRLLVECRRPRLGRQASEDLLDSEINYEIDQTKTVRCRGLKYLFDIMSYTDEGGDIAVWIYNEPISSKLQYFETNIISIGNEGKIVVGLTSYKYPLNKYPGSEKPSVGYHGDHGRLFQDGNTGTLFGTKFYPDDTIGCGIIFTNGEQAGQKATVFFTKNGREVGRKQVIIPYGGFHPAVALDTQGQECLVDMKTKWVNRDTMSMAVDTCQNDWSRLHDIKLNGQILEYTGRGSGITDVGLAQAKHPLDTMHHFFEIEIVDPGDSCFIAIGVASKNYPKHRHPGWNKGSVAYHADDGKIFCGSGVGDQFGPRCERGDIMGCGIYFPRDYYQEHTLKKQLKLMKRKMMMPESLLDQLHDFGDLSSSSDEEADEDSESEDEQWFEKEKFKKGPPVEIFFTKNGKLIGKRQVRVPVSGFYPTVGMLSCSERVRVDLQPLTG